MDSRGWKKSDPILICLSGNRPLLTVITKDPTACDSNKIFLDPFRILQHFTKILGVCQDLSKILQNSIGSY